MTKWAIITGGESAEREVSWSSARSVQEALGIDDSRVFDWPIDRDRIERDMTDYDVVLPMVHGRGGEDGEIQRFLESIQKGYVFSRPEVHAVCLDKQTTKRMVAEQDVPVRLPQTFDEYESGICIAKPNNGGSSVATRMIHSRAEFDAWREEFPDDVCVLEEYVRGREFSIGAIEYGGEVVALPVTEIVHGGEIFDYVKKYDADQLAKEVCPAVIDIELANTLQAIARRVHEVMDCRHMSRTDVIVTEEGEVYFLEVNTIPGLTPTSIIVQQLEKAGLGLGAVIKNWVEKKA